MQQFESKVTVETTEHKQIIQLSGDAEFIEHYLPIIMANYSHFHTDDTTNDVQAFHENAGYISKTIESDFAGVKKNKDGSKRYQCFYVCPHCLDKGKYFIARDHATIHCRNCHAPLKPKQILNHSGIKMVDRYGNHYQAGDSLVLTKIGDNYEFN